MGVLKGSPNQIFIRNGLHPSSSLSARKHHLWERNSLEYWQHHLFNLDVSGNIGDIPAKAVDQPQDDSKFS